MITLSTDTVVHPKHWTVSYKPLDVWMMFVKLTKRFQCSQRFLIIIMIFSSLRINSGQKTSCACFVVDELCVTNLHVSHPPVDQSEISVVCNNQSEISIKYCLYQPIRDQILLLPVLVPRLEIVSADHNVWPEVDLSHVF